ncbi:MAG: hypothetical protein ACW97X_03460 [Candidatus Hodarchaeales archaeon]|jgi:hypothetical protein
MNKTEKHKRDLIEIFSDFVKTGDDKTLIKYLINNSNLPGRRANLELGKAFIKTIEDHLVKDSEQMWNLLLKLLNFTPETAPTNDPQEFLPFCATWALGIIGAKVDQYSSSSISKIKILANDPRWRMREAVAKALHILLRNKDLGLINELKNWVNREEWLIMRAVATGVANPSLLEDLEYSEVSLDLHKQIFHRIKEVTNNKTEEFKALKKGLGYSLSVVVQAIPEDGFKFMNEYATSNNEDIIKILKDNLKKNRLTKKYPKMVKSTLKKMD